MQPVEWCLTVTYNTGMVVEVRPADQDWVVAFVNEYGTEPRREADEQEEPYPPMDALGAHDAFKGAPGEAAASTLQTFS